ncbi:MAG: 2-phosphoglycerate kinase [Actinomycetota bacterium]|nr:2-phosphoglycerate kinase [Actinomycetota bacterium]
MTEKQARPERIIIADEENRLPYSKGLMAMSIMATGLSPEKAYSVAAEIHETLRDEGAPVVTTEHVRNTAEKVLERSAGAKYVEIYRRWHSVSLLGKPLIILIGGATGVGKSTIATTLAARLGITRIVSTDVIREVMRSLFTPAVIPSLFNSSFRASDALRIPLPPTTDKLILGFLEQAATVWVGVKALIERAIVEKTNFIIEGAHLVPGVIESGFFKDAFVVQFVLAVEDEEKHRSHFESRDVQTGGSRPVERYLESFSNIRRIQEYVLELAQQKKVPVFPCYNFDSTLNTVLEYVINQFFTEYSEGEVGEKMLEEAIGTPEENLGRWLF